MIKILLKEMIKQKSLTGLSLRDLAKEIGISHVALWKMTEDQKYNPTLDALDKLCVFFKCQPGSLLKHVKN